MVTREELVREVQENFPSLLWALDHPVLAPLLAQAVDEEWGPERLQSELQGTDWWKETTDRQRQLEALRNTSEATYNAMIASEAAALGVVANSLGVPVSDAVLKDLALQSLGFTWNDAQKQSALLGYASTQLKQLESGEVSGVLGLSFQQMENLANAYYAPLSQQTIDGWLLDIASGRRDIDAFRQRLESLALEQFPWLSEEMKSQLKAGTSLRELFEPYQQTIADILGRAPTEVDLGKSRWRQLMVNPETGQVRSLGEMGDAVRGTKEWLGSNEAQALGVSIGDAVREAFGRKVS